MEFMVYVQMEFFRINVHFYKVSTETYINIMYY